MLKYNHYLKLITCLGLLISFSIASAQNNPPTIDGKKKREIKGTARTALRLGDTYTALFYYQEWAKLEPSNLKITNQVAELYWKTRNYIEAEKWCQKVVDENAEKYPLSLFYLGRAQMAQEKYEEAKKNFAKFKKMARDLKDPGYRKLVSNDLESCDYAISMKDSTPVTVVEHLGNSINQAHVEFSPVPVDQNTFIYGSLRDDAVNYYDVALHDSMQIPLRKFYYAEKEGEEWVSKGEFQGPFNKDNAHVGNGALSQDGKRFYFTICQKNWQNKVICHLYYSKKEDDGWGEPISLGDEVNLPNYTSTQPAVGRESRKNAEVIYFVTDRPRSKGGWDIWYTEYYARRDKFKKPRSCGAKINSAGTESTPYYDLSTHTLYYSTDGKPGFGGLDVHKAEGEKSRWDNHENMGKNVNSSADDIDFTWNKDHKSGFFVSNRKGGVALLNETCCDDIYEFKLVEYININLMGDVLDSAKCLEGAELYVYIKNKETGDKYLTEQLELEGCKFDIPLQQGYEYYLEARKDGYFNSNAQVTTVGIKESTTLETELNLKKIPDKPIVLPGILYEFDSAELTPGAKTEIDTALMPIMIDNPDIIIQISSHTDSRGSDSYNMKLSARRAESVVKYLISSGINKKRLKSEGFGETVPVAPNENPDGSDNPEGRALNRRTEFQIIGRLDLEDEDIDEPEPEEGEEDESED